MLEDTTASDNIQRQYDYNYDNLNRLVSARTADNIFNEYIEAYDKNGNIMKLTRFGLLNDSSGTRAVIDNLNYYYKPDSNVLLKVTDQTTNPLGFKDDGFRSGPHGGISDQTDDYAYDDYGNLIIDENKGIGSGGRPFGITYNHLNQPIKVKINYGEITYIYDALGRKVQKSIFDPNMGGRYSTTRTEYMHGGFMYKSPGYNTIKTRQKCSNVGTNTSIKGCTKIIKRNF